MPVTHEDLFAVAIRMQSGRVHAAVVSGLEIRVLLGDIAGDNPVMWDTFPNFDPGELFPLPVKDGQQEAIKLGAIESVNYTPCSEDAEAVASSANVAVTDAEHGTFYL